VTKFIHQFVAYFYFIDVSFILGWETSVRVYGQRQGRLCRVHRPNKQLITKVLVLRFRRLEMSSFIFLLRGFFGEQRSFLKSGSPVDRQNESRTQSLLPALQEQGAQCIQVRKSFFILNNTHYLLCETHTVNFILIVLCDSG
jgi:hypothetical protein